MRQDPDVLVAGETRDLETAKTAIEAALTGHLVPALARQRCLTPLPD